MLVCRRQLCVTASGARLHNMGMPEDSRWRLDAQSKESTKTKLSINLVHDFKKCHSCLDHTVPSLMLGMASRPHSMAGLLSC